MKKKPLCICKSVLSLYNTYVVLRNIYSDNCFQTMRLTKYSNKEKNIKKFSSVLL